MDSVVIKFESDISGLQPAVDILEKIGQVDKVTADQFRKANVDYQARKKAVDDLNASQKAGESIAQQSVKNIGDLSKAFNNLGANIAGGTINEVIKETLPHLSGSVDATRERLNKLGESGGDAFNSLKDALNSSEKVLNEFGNTSSVVIDKQTSLRTQIRQTKDELSRMEEAGLAGTQAFDDLALHGAQLEHQFERTNERLRVLASPTFKFDALLEGVRGLTAGFGLAEGAQSLLGNKSKEFEETLIKLNGIMILANSLQEIQSLITTQNAAVTAVEIAQKRIAIAATQLDTAVQSENIIVRYAAIAAQKALNLAMSASPAGILLLAIGALAGAFIFLTSKTESATEAQLKLNDAQKASLDATRQREESIKQVSDARIQALEKEKASAEFENKSRSELREIEKKIDLERINAAHDRVEVNRKNINEILNNEDGFLKKIEGQKDLLIELERKKAEGIKSIYSPVKQQNIPIQDAIDVTKNFVDNQLAAYQIAKSALKDYNDAEINLFNNTAKRRQEAANELLTDQKAAIQARLIIDKAGSDQQLKDQVALIEKEKEIQQKALRPDQVNEKVRLENEANQKILEARSQFNIRLINEQIKLDEAALVSVQKGSDEELKLRLKIIDEQAAADIEKTGQTEKEKAAITIKALNEKNELIKQFNIKAQQDKDNLDKQAIATQLAVVKFNLQQETSLKQDAIESQADADKLAVQNSVDTEENKAARIKLIDEKSAADKKKLQDDLAKHEIENAASVAEKLLAIENTKAEVQINDPNISAEEKISLNRKVLENNLASLQIQSNAEDKKFAEGLISFEEYTNSKLDIYNKFIKAKGDLDAFDVQKEIEDRKKVEEFTIDSAQKVNDFIAQQQRDANQQVLNESLSRIETERQAEIDKINAVGTHETAAERTKREKIQKINDEFNRREAAIKQEAFDKQKEADTTSALINGALGITKSIAVLGPPVFPNVAGILGVASVILETGLQVAAIQAKEAPKFFKGVEKLEGPGTATSDSIDAKLSVGERVVAADVNKDYFPALSAIHNRKISPEFANKILSSFENKTELIRTFQNIGRIKDETIHNNEYEKAMDRMEIVLKVEKKIFYDINNDEKTPDTIIEQKKKAFRKEQEAANAKVIEVTNVLSKATQLNVAEVKKLSVTEEHKEQLVKRIKKINQTGDERIRTGAIKSLQEYASRVVTVTQESHRQLMADKKQKFEEDISRLNINLQNYDVRSFSETSKQVMNLPMLKTVFDTLPVRLMIPEDQISSMMNIHNHAPAIDYDKITKPIIDGINNAMEQRDYYNKRDQIKRDENMDRLISKLSDAIHEKRTHDWK